MNKIKNKSILLIILAIFIVMSVIGCSKNEVLKEEQKPDESLNNSEEDMLSKDEDSISEKEIVEIDKVDEIEDENEDELEEEEVIVDLKATGVNELGQIMVLMYHGIDQEESVWVRTPDNFRRDLKTLYDKGYRPISMKDYINGYIDVPAGTTPFVLTFDDSLQNQFNILDNGNEFEIDPDCAVAIIEEFSKEYSDFKPNATFYVFYPTPFRQEEYVKEKFEYLINLGMEIGNHAYNHENLRMDMETKEPRDASFVQEALGKNVQSTNSIIPDYNVNSLALPYGASPQDDAVREYVVKGQFEDTNYHNEAVLLVGANPARPSYHTSTDMSKIPRIRASETDTEDLGLYDWLEYFDNNPESRFISDGNPDTISFPASLEENLDSSQIGDKIIQPYE